MNNPLLICIFFLLAPVFNATDFKRQIFAGYQGWFNTPKNGAHRWIHWSRGDSPAPGKVTFEIYPDLTEYPESALETTNLGNLGNGAPSKLYTADTDEVINLHLGWMQKYGIDGIALQRFVSELRDSTMNKWRTSVLERIQRIAPQHHRHFYLEYDITGSDSNTLTDTIRRDWEYVNNKFGLVNNPYYAKSDGKPVVALWGYGFAHNRANPDHLREISTYMRKQGIYLILGVPYKWREGGVKPGFRVDDFLKNANMIQPWAVGSFKSSHDLYAAGHITQIIKDKELCLSWNVEYQRVIWPGFAWSNWNGGTRNMIPRHGGQFFRDQFSFTYQVEPTYSSMFIAMFDEFDEGTAIAKAAPDRSMIPTSQYFLTLDADGLKLPSDHYLKVAGELTAYYHQNVAPNCDLHRQGVLPENQALDTNCRLHSTNFACHLLIQNNGYFAIYDKTKRVFKSPNKDTGKGPWKLFMQNDGNLVFYDSHRKALWASNSAGKGNGPYHLEMQVDGNLVIYDGSHKPIWSSK